MSCNAIGRHLLSNPSHLELHLFQEAQYCIQRFGKDTITWIFMRKTVFTSQQKKMYPVQLRFLYFHFQIHSYSNLFTSKHRVTTHRWAAEGFMRVAKSIPSIEPP